MEKIKSLIEQIKTINEKHEVIKKLNGEHFNIFSILRLETREVDTHSYFIYELLNPKGSHNQGDVFLKLFLKQILKEEYKDDSIVEVKRETLTNKDRRIDFTIETSNLLIAIEMKIEARDQENQLFDYDEYIKTKKKNTKLYYLTLHGTEASEESLGKLTDKDYKKLSFYDDIHSWIEECIEKSSTVPILREGLVHYRNLIRKLTNQMGDEMSEEIATIVKSAEDMKAIHTIYSEYGNILARKEAKFWCELYEKLKEKKYAFEVDSLTKEDGDKDYKIIAEGRKKRTNEYFGLSLTKQVQAKETIQIYCTIYLKDKDELTMDIKFYKNDKIIPTEKKNSLLKKIGFIKTYESSHVYFELENQVKFYGDGEPTFDLFDKEKFEKIVEKISEEVLKTLKNISEKEVDLLKDI